MIYEEDSGMLSPGWAGSTLNIVGDQAWIAAALRVEASLAKCQAKLDIIPQHAAEVIEEVTNNIQINPRELAVGVRDTSNPAIPLVQILQQAVDAAEPGTSNFLHLGATSQDIVDSAMMIVATNALYQLEVFLAEIRQNVVTLIEKYGDSPMVGRTISQHALPMTFGVKASSWLNGLIDASEHVSGLIEQGLPISLGGASGTLAAFQAYGRRAQGDTFDPFSVVEAVASELGLSPHYQPWHTVRTPILEIASCLSLVSGIFGKIAADIHVMSRTEIGEVNESLGESMGVSSSMPQKQNPVTTVLILAAAKQLPALTLIVQQALVAEDERPVGAWQSEWHPLREAFRLALGSAQNMVNLSAGLKVNADRMLENLRMTGPAVISERLNVVLTPIIGRLKAKQLLREVLTDENIPVAEMTIALKTKLLASADDLRDLDLDELLEPTHYTGVANEIVRRALARNAKLDR